MKKALIVSNSSGLVTSFLKNDVELLLDRGYEVICACNTKYSDINTNQFFKKYKIKVIHIEFPIRDLNVKRLILSYLSLKRILAHDKYSIIHCHSTIAAALVRQAAKKYRSRGTKVVYTSHGFPFYKGASGKKTLLYWIIEKHYSKYTDALITICKEDYKNAKKMRCQKVYKINGVGIDLSRFDLKEFSRDEYRANLGFAPDETVILSIGELNTNKNHRVIIQALSGIKDKKSIYVICGREVTEKGKKDELLTLADELGVDLRFLGYRNDIPEVCYSCDIGAIPSFKEGLGISGIEMLASGLPVVGSNRQGIKDYVIDGKTGYLADPTNEKSFLIALKKTMGMTGYSDRCKKMARKFDSNQARIVIDKVYEEILGDKIIED